MTDERMAWPELDWNEWKETAATLHMLLQIVGKTRLALTRVQNHWWNVPLYLTARGLWTSPMNIGAGQTLDIDFDFLDHCLTFRTSSGKREHLTLRSAPVKEMFVSYQRILSNLDISLHFSTTPVEVSEPIPFDQDDQHKTYDANAVTRFWNVLRLTDVVLKEFSTGFYGKISPVHFFWGSMDLAVTRFSGRRAPSRFVEDPVQAEAYSHEVISAGFWPGNGGYGQAAFYAYAAPVPVSLPDAQITPPAAFNRNMGEFVFNYADFLRSGSPTSDLLRFLNESYSAAANAAGWDRSILDRQEPYKPAARTKTTS